MKNDPKKQTKGKKHEIASKMGKNQKIKNKTKKLRCSPNPKKVNDLTALGLNHVSREKHVHGVGESNKRYLNAKRDWGHRLADEDLV